MTLPEPAVPAPGKVAVLGAGSWGTTFAKVLADAAAAAGAERTIQLLSKSTPSTAMSNTLTTSPFHQ